MGNQVQLTLSPTFIKHPPHIILIIDNEFIFDSLLTEQKEFQHNPKTNISLKLQITRSGRTKEITHNDPTNGFEISNYTVNGVQIDPAIGSFYNSNNDYVKSHTVHANKFTLNGEYILEIPYYPLNGEIIKNIDRFNTKNQHNQYSFFGASMTDYDFTKGLPPIFNKKNYADLFLHEHNGINLSSGGQTNQEVFETVYRYLEHNTAEIVFAQLVSTVVRQVKDQDTKKIKRYSPHTDGDLDWFDEFTQSNLKSIQNYFVNLDVAPIIALQIPDYQKLIDYAEDRGSKIFFISYFRDEYDTFNSIFPNNIAPYFNIDPNTKYCKDNGHHATPEEQENYFQSIVDFIGKIT